MPCWEMNTMSVEFSAKSLDSLREAAERLGMHVREHAYGATVLLPSSTRTIELDFKREKATLDSALQGRLNNLKRSYSEVVLEKVAAKKKWILKKRAENKFEMKRL